MVAANHYDDDLRFPSKFEVQMCSKIFYHESIQVPDKILANLFMSSKSKFLDHYILQIASCKISYETCVSYADFIRLTIFSHNFNKLQTTTLFQTLAQLAEKREKSAAGAAALEYLECIFARKCKANKYKNNEDKYEKMKTKKNVRQILKRSSSRLGMA